MANYRLFLFVIFILIASPGCAIYHHYGEYYGKVVDAETKEPLEGAVVLAEYITWQWGSPGGEVPSFLDAQEAVTDKNGEFKIPALKAFAFRPLNTFNHNPYFMIFKPRYKCYEGSVKFYPNYTLPVDTNVFIEMQELRTKEERLKNTGCYPGTVPYRKMKKLVDINNIENADLGLKQTHVQETKNE